MVGDLTFEIILLALPALVLALAGEGKLVALEQDVKVLRLHTPDGHGHMKLLILRINPSFDWRNDREQCPRGSGLVDVMLKDVVENAFELLFQAEQANVFPYSQVCHR